MRVRRFDTRVKAGPRGRAVIEIPFDPDQAWGAKAEHPVAGTINGQPVRGTITPGGRGWALTVTPMWMRDAGVAVGSDVTVELAPEGPQRGDLADDIAAALDANPPPRRSSTRWRSSTARPTCAGSRPRPGGRTCVRCASPRSLTCLRPGSSNGRHRERVRLSGLRARR